jgi:D-methionine transport system permease protein
MFNKALYETIYMTAISTLFVFVLGLTLGLLLYNFDEQGLSPNKSVYRFISFTTSLFRSIPFLILIVLLIPFTKVLIGTILGPSAALPALIIGATPFYARLVELALNEKGKYQIDKSLLKYSLTNLSLLSLEELLSQQF